MAPAPGERRAERDVHPIARSVATGRDAGMGTDRETLQILFEQDVDHASAGARPPGRRRAPRPHPAPVPHPARAHLQIIPAGAPAPNRTRPNSPPPPPPPT